MLLTSPSSIASLVLLAAVGTQVDARWSRSKWLLRREKQRLLKNAALKSAKSLTNPKKMAWHRKQAYKKKSYKRNRKSKLPSTKNVIFHEFYTETADGREFGWSTWNAASSTCQNGRLRISRVCHDEISGEIDYTRCRDGKTGGTQFVPCSLTNMDHFSINRFVHKQQRVTPAEKEMNLEDFDDQAVDLENFHVPKSRAKRDGGEFGTSSEFRGWTPNNGGYVSANGMSYTQPKGGEKQAERIKKLEVMEGSGDQCCEDLYTCGDHKHFYKSGKFKFHGLDEGGKAIYQKPDAGFYFLSQYMGRWQLSSDILSDAVTSYMYNEDWNRTCLNDIGQTWKNWGGTEHSQFTSGCGETLENAVFSCGKPFVDAIVGGQRVDEPITSSFPTERVTGGEQAVPHSYPWQVSIRAGHHFCGGALIRPDWVVTAAHCAVFFKNWGFSVMVGEHNVKENDASQQQICIETIYIHPKFHKPAPHLGNDIAILKLSWPVTLNEYIAPICLPPPDMKFDEKSYCIVSGWGKTDPMALNATDVLMQAKLEIAKDNKTCAYHDDKIMCAGGKGKGSCNGDSGGPLQCYVDGTWYLAGIVSFGMSDGKDIKCAAWEYPSMFTRVTKHYNWILGGINRHGKETAKFGEWSEWSECSEPCGGTGTRKRGRECIGRGSCIGDIEQSEGCNFEPCKDRCLLSDVGLFGDSTWATGDCVGNTKGYTRHNMNCRIKCQDKKLVPKDTDGMIVKNVRCRCSSAHGCKWRGPKSVENPQIHCVDGGECVHPLLAFKDTMDSRLWLIDNKSKVIHSNETSSFPTGTRLWIRCPPPPGLTGPQLPASSISPTRMVCKAMAEGKTMVTRFYPKPPSKIDGLKVCPGIRYNQMGTIQD